LAKSLVFPTTLNVAVRKQAPTVPLPAPRYWQSRHQQMRVVMGGSSLSQRTAPQRHPPVTVIPLSKVKYVGTVAWQIVRLAASFYAQCRLTLRCSRLATAAFGGPRERLSSNVRAPTWLGATAVQATG